MSDSPDSTVGSAEVLVRTEALRTWFPIRRGVLARTAGHVRAVDGVSIEIRRGETLGLVGESGCGKTTLGRTIVGLEKPLDGKVFYDGSELAGLSPPELRRLRRKMQMIFQDPFSSLNPRMTAMDIVTEGVVEHGLADRRRREETARTLMAEVGLDPESIHRYPHEFSGGQRQRISVARAMSMRPEFVVCDEAVSALDVSVQAQIVNLLLDLRARHGLSYLFISHDLSVVRHISHRVAVMYLGQIVESGPAGVVMAEPAHPYTRALISAIPKPLADRGERIVLEGDVPSPSRPPAGCRFHPRCPFVQDRCRTTVPELSPFAEEPSSADHVAACLRKEELRAVGVART